MGETDWGRNWVLFWWTRPCSVNLESNFLLMGGGAAWLHGTGAASAQHWRDFEEIPRIQGQRRSPSRTVGGTKSRLRIKPHTRQRRSEGSNKAVHQDPETPQRLSAEEVRVSSGLLQGQRLWVQQTWVWHKPSWSVQESPVEVWFGGGLLQGWGHWVEQCLHGAIWRRKQVTCC